MAMLVGVKIRCGSRDEVRYLIHVLKNAICKFVRNYLFFDYKYVGANLCFYIKAIISIL